MTKKKNENQNKKTSGQEASPKDSRLAVEIRTIRAGRAAGSICANSKSGSIHSELENCCGGK